MRRADTLSHPCVARHYKIRNVQTCKDEAIRLRIARMCRADLCVSPTFLTLHFRVFPHYRNTPFGRYSPAQVY